MCKGSWFRYQIILVYIRTRVAEQFHYTRSSSAAEFCNLQYKMPGKKADQSSNLTEIWKQLRLWLRMLASEEPLIGKFDFCHSCLITVFVQLPCRLYCQQGIYIYIYKVGKSCFLFCNIFHCLIHRVTCVPDSLPFSFLEKERGNSTLQSSCQAASDLMAITVKKFFAIYMGRRGRERKSQGIIGPLKDNNVVLPCN